MLRGTALKNKTRKAISIEKRVGITLWTSCEYRTVSHLFGVGRSTVCFIVAETCNAIVKVLMPLYIRIPSEPEMRIFVNGFETKWGFPKCLGALMAPIFQFQHGVARKCAARVFANSFWHFEQMVS